MTAKHPIEIFMPPNMLKAKVGGRFGGVDIAAIKRAEQALEELKTEFGEWINDDVAKLVKARATYEAAQDAETRNDLYRASHDLRGQALTFEFPLAARIAASLCKLLDGKPGSIPQALIDAHVDAIGIVVRQNMKGDGDRTARALGSELEARVAEFLEALGDKA